MSYFFQAGRKQRGRSRSACRPHGVSHGSRKQPGLTPERLSAFYQSISVYVLLCVFAGCELRSEVANLPSKPVDGFAEPVMPEIDAEPPAQLLQSEPIKDRSKVDPVLARLSVSKAEVAAGETFEITVELDVDSGYEIHSVDALPPKVPTLLELDLPPGFTAIEEWNVPAAVRSFNPGGESVYVGTVKFVRKIQVASEAKAGEHLLACSASYQACSSRQCLRPVRGVMSVVVVVGE